ncbi:MAG: glycerophosphodiester phosphodiesterase [Actinomycetota bacterium]
MSPRLPALQQPPIGFGHRGAMADAPENTIPSFRLAIEMGATGIESDVWLTADGVPVLDHDGRVGGRVRRRRIAAVERAALPDHIPALADLYDVAGTDFPISLDLKDPDAFEPVLAVARAAGDDAERSLWLCHPDLDRLTSWRPRTSARLVNSVRLSRLPNGLERRTAELRDRSIDAVNLFHTEWNGGRIALAHRFERLALGWGPRFQREVAALIDGGIDGVYSDHVDRMMAVITEFYGPFAP